MSQPCTSHPCLSTVSIFAFSPSSAIYPAPLFLTANHACDSYLKISPATFSIKKEVSKHIFNNLKQCSITFHIMFYERKGRTLMTYFYLSLVRIRRIESAHYALRCNYILSRNLGFLWETSEQIAVLGRAFFWKALLSNGNLWAQ